MRWLRVRLEISGAAGGGVTGGRGVTGGKGGATGVEAVAAAAGVVEAAAEAAGAALVAAGAPGARLYDGDGAGGPARVEAHFGVGRAEEGRAAARAIAAAVGGRVASVRWVEEPDWSRAWRARARAVSVGRFFLHPAHLRPRAGRINLAIDPGAAFGTGRHPATRLVLREIAARAARRGEGLGRFLDLGCGSGVLAMAAARLGARPVVAADTDPRAVEVAKVNARANGLGRRIRFVVGGLAACVGGGGGFDTVAANLTAAAHVELARAYAARGLLRPGGALILSGVRAAEAAAVTAATGARVVRREGGWVALRLSRGSENSTP